MQMEKNRLNMLLYLEILVCYIRVLWILSSIDEKKTIVAMADAAVFLSKNNPRQTSQQSIDNQSDFTTGSKRNSSVNILHGDK